MNSMLTYENRTSLIWAVNEGRVIYRHINKRTHVRGDVGLAILELTQALMSSENGVNPPVPNPSHSSNFSLLLVIGIERLTGPNYMDWMRNLRFTLRYENKEYAYEMNQQLKEMFQAKASKERLDVVKSLMACKLKPGASICPFGLKMKGYFDRLKSLNMVFDAELSINIILSGLPAVYNKPINKETTMAEPNGYITATQKKFISNDNKGRMVKKCIVEIQGTFLVKIRDETFNGNVGENALSVFPVSLAGAASEWFTKECLGSITTWDNMVEKFILKFHHLFYHNEEEETEEDDNPNEKDNVPKIFKIEGNLFDFETPLCEAFHEFNCLLKIDTDLFTYDIQNFKTYDKYKRELNNTKQRVLKNHGQKIGWYNELADGKLKDETLALKAKIEGSWGDATPRIAPFTRMENFRRGPYANIKTKWASNPHIDVNRIFGRDYKASNVGCTQENQGHKGDPILKPSNCKVKRFEMMKYSFDDDEEYITIKESEYLNHSKDILDAYRELLCLINEG
ncbi:hypothetical protein Tco_0707954 [Tanacetum coccineum]